GADGPVRLATLPSPRLPGRPLHLPLPGRAGSAIAVPSPGDAARRGRGIHDLALPPRPDGPADDRSQDRHRGIRRRQVPAQAGGAQPGLPRSAAASHLPGAPAGPSGTAPGSRRPDAVPLRGLKDGFQRFLTAEPDRLHAAAHSHHPWPDISYDAHRRAWEDAARMVDDKWDRVFETVIPSARAKVADVLGLPDPATLVFAPNTHEFVLRIASTLPRPFTVLTTDSEFHSFARQLERWEEAGVATATRVAAEPFDSFPDRLASAFADHHLVFFSHVHFNSGYVVPGLAELIGAFPSPATVVVDGYH